jgi:hypothetical protein
MIAALELRNILTMSSKGILDRQVPKGKSEINLSAFSFLFSEIIQYCQSTVSNVSELERRYVSIYMMKHEAN